MQKTMQVESYSNSPFAFIIFSLYARLFQYKRRPEYSTFILNSLKSGVNKSVLVRSSDYAQPLRTDHERSEFFISDEALEICCPAFAPTPRTNKQRFFDAWTPGTKSGFAAMRLLHFEQAGRLLLTDFSGKAVPPYAILSHRWGDSEVLFEDIASESYTEKQGYRKVEFCAKQAAKDHLQYFWIDTCCINKWNLDELSRSINSMFRWYKNARKCYVFLPDVLVTDQLKDWEASFRASEWFRRGWTLQELIAPESVEFFSLEEQRIGDKQSLEQLIYEITDVPIEALQGCSLDKFTTSERIEWTTSRETTEEEDIVYCLLGILDISMPASYGEGREKARIRLEAEVNSSAPFLVPFSQNDNFVGRESHLAKLEAKLFKEKQTTRMAIVGPGGTGKSQLALELAYRTRKHNKNCSIFWVDASSIDRIHQSYANIARKLKIPGWNDDKTDVLKMVKLHLSKAAAQSLVIFDNADDDGLTSAGWSTAGTATLTAHLPYSDLCSILFTTTDNDVAERLASHDIIELQNMAPDTALSMLEQLLDVSMLRDERLEAAFLLQELDYLPLAIMQAAAYINARNITLQEYRTQLTRLKQGAFYDNNNLKRDVSRERTTESFVATMLLSVSQIRNSNPLAEEYLFFMACVDRKDIVIEFLDAPSPREREKAIKTISSYKLATRRPAESALDLHRLVHCALQDHLQQQGLFDRWIQTAITKLARLFPDESHSNRSKWRRMLPHAKYALSHNFGSREGTERTKLAWKCAEALMSDGQYNESKILFAQVAKVREGALGVDHPETLTTISNLGLVSSMQGKYKEAEAIHRQVLQRYEKTIGLEDLNTLISVNNLGLVLSRQGKYEQAEIMHRRALQGREKLGEDHPDVLASVNNLGLVLERQNKCEEAVTMYQRALRGRERVLGVEHPDTLASTNNLGSVFSRQGNYKKAEVMHRRALQGREKELKEWHPNTLASVNNLGLVLEKQGRYKEAEAMYRRALQGREEVLREEHPDTLVSINNLGSESDLGVVSLWPRGDVIQIVNALDLLDVRLVCDRKGNVGMCRRRQLAQKY
ncbi:kinesin light chain [Periconia macrospinosa]|uniref:Kinesin light chain n=1 Tax=Periconia macrospinosa TaxID=97972 RepID=A0A2V1DKC9_9PLEO|nr:kinesin light chain [Periconia macrospinosa]